MPWKKVGGPANSLALYAGDWLAALTPDRRQIWRRDPGGGEWKQIWTAGARRLVGGGRDLYLESLQRGDLHRYDGVGWAKVGEPADQFVAVGNAVYALDQGRTRIRRYDRDENRWVTLVGSGERLIAGGQRVYVATANNRAICEWSRYDRRWTEIGGPGAEWVGVGATVYGLTPDRQAIYRYSGTPKRWDRIGGPALALVGGGAHLYAVRPGARELWRYEGEGENWTKVGSPGFGFVVHDRSIYGLTPDRSAVYAFDGAEGETLRLRELLHRAYADESHGARVMRGFLVKSHAGPVLAEYGADVGFQPLSVLKLVPYLHAIVEIDKNPKVTMETEVSWYQPRTGNATAKNDTTCLSKGPTTELGKAKLKEALPTMMWQSHNRTLDAVMGLFGVQSITRRVQSLGLRSTEMYSGCAKDGKQKPWRDNVTTLHDMARLYEGVASGSFLSTDGQRRFYDNMIENSARHPSYTSAITGASFGPGTLDGLRRLVEDQARDMGKASTVVDAFMPHVVLHEKGGSWNPPGDNIGFTAAAELGLPFRVLDRGSRSMRVEVRKFTLGWYFGQMRVDGIGPTADAEIFVYEGNQRWTRAGSAGAEWVAVGQELYGLTCNRGEVWHRRGADGHWSKIGGPMQQLIAARNRLYAIQPGSGDIHEYGGTPGRWTKVGGPGHSFVGAGNALFGLTPDRKAVYVYSGQPERWTMLRGPTEALVGGGNQLYVIEPGSKDISARIGSTWTKIGGPGASFVAQGTLLYGLTSNKAEVWSFGGTPEQWTKVGGAAETLAMAGGKLYGLNEGGGLFEYSGSGDSWTWTGRAWSALVGGGQQLYARPSVQQARDELAEGMYRAPIRQALATW